MRENNKKKHNEKENKKKKQAYFSLYFKNYRNNKLFLFIVELKIKNYNYSKYYSH